MEPQGRQIKWEWRYALGVLGLAFWGYIFLWATFYGKADNVLHQNAQFYSALLSGFILGGLGWGEIAAMLQSMRK